MTRVYKWLSLSISLMFMLLMYNGANAQARVQVKVVSVQVLNNVDCDGFLTGDSDFVIEYIATDNTVGNSNNNPTLFGFLGDFNYAYQNGNNGPWTLTSPNGNINPNSGIFFDHEYVCPSDVPTNIRIDWQGYENDAPTNYDLTGGAFSEVRTGAQIGNIAVPVAPGTVSQTFNASGTSGCGTQNYRITIEVTRIALNPLYWEDDVCNAPQIIMGTSQTRAYCPPSLQPNEPAQGDIANNGSVWFYFVAPASGRVDISTDNSGTDFGTEIHIYHAADGVGCTAGIHLPTLTLVKDKFEFLSSVDRADLGGFANVFGEADITFDDCAGIFSSNPLVAGEVYYVQMSADNGGDRGYIEVSVSDLGGSPAEAYDIPCRGTDVTATATSTTVRTEGNGQPASAYLTFGCATGRETGDPHTSNNPDQYQAYDYDHNATNNGTVNESIWTSFIAPNSGRVYFEGNVEGLFGVNEFENTALFGYDPRFAPGVPADYLCANLSSINAAEGGSVISGPSPTAIINQECLEPGYRYYAMVDPSAAATADDAYFWLYDPSASDPINNPPNNDILCQTMLSTLYDIPVQLVGQPPLPFQSVAGTNVRACIETLAGEPFSNPNPANRADQTVWHYFTVPPSGVIEIRLRAYVGLNALNYAIYPLLNGASCYGGLAPATFTSDGTRFGAQLVPVAQGTTDFSGTTVSFCCLTPGARYALQLDGGSPGDVGQYIVEFINEIEVYAGDSQYETMMGDSITYNGGDTAYICFNDSIFPSVMLDPLGQSTTAIPGCLDVGFVMHNTLPIPSPIANTGFSYIDSTNYQALNFFVNNTNGSGTFGNPLFNQVYYVSAMADEDATWGQLTCPSASIENGAPVVFLQPIVAVNSYNSNTCEISFSATGGLPAYNGGVFDYVITNTNGDTLMGSAGNGVTVVYQIPIADTYTIVMTDGAGCEQTMIVNALTCNDPCIFDPVRIMPRPIDSTVYTCFPGGDSAMVTIQIAGGYPASNTSQYSITLSGSSAAGANGVYSSAGSAAPTPFSFVVRDNDTWTVIVTDTSGCSDTISHNFTYSILNCPDFCVLNPIVASSGYTCFANGSSLVEITIGGGLPSIDGSNYSVSVSGSTVFGQTFNNAQVAGTIGGTGLISFLVNDGDSWTVTILDGNGCTDTLMGNYIFNSTNCPNLCQIMPVVITPNPATPSIYSCNANGTINVDLFFSGGVPASSGGNFTVVVSGSSIASQNGTFVAGLGTYSFNTNMGDNWMVIVSDANNCADTISDIVALNSIGIAASSYVCNANGTADLTFTLSGGNPSINGSDYLVTLSGLSTGGNLFNSPVTGTIGGNATITVTVGDGDIWQAFVNDGQNCTVTLSDTFNWNSTNCGNICGTAPNVLINGGNDTISYDCDGLGNAMLLLEFTGGIPALGGTSNTYTANVTINGSTNTQQVTYNGSFGTLMLNLEDGDVWEVVVSDAVGCSYDSLGATFVAVNAVATTDITYEIFVGEPAQLIGSSSTGNITSYLWSPAGSIQDPTAAVTSSLPIATTWFTLEVRDDNDCSDIDSVRVQVGGCVPDFAGFTPNTDGVNDLWVIPCLDLLPGDLEVYNRWGQLVYRKESYDNSWNGTHYQTGQDLPDATYYYVLKVTYPNYPNPVLYKGTVTIIR